MTVKSVPAVPAARGGLAAYLLGARTDSVPHSFQLPPDMLIKALEEAMLQGQLGRVNLVGFPQLFDTGVHDVSNGIIDGCHCWCHLQCHLNNLHVGYKLNFAPPVPGMAGGRHAMLVVQASHICIRHFRALKFELSIAALLIASNLIPKRQPLHGSALE